LERTLATTYMAPNTDLERMIVQLFEEATGVQGVGVEDDFFELGGESLRAIQMASRLSSMYAINVMTVMPFGHPNPRALAETIEDVLRKKLLSMSDEEVRLHVSSASKS
jgi:fengycin family lipopeptide synthetase D